LHRNKILYRKIHQAFQSDFAGRQISESCPAPFAKIFLFPPDPNHFYIVSRPTPHEGRIAIVTDAGWDAVDAAASGARGDRRAS
jgi:hypothetical protein